MNKNVVIVLAGAVLVAVIVAVLVQLIFGAGTKPEVITEAKVEVLVAARTLNIGHELAEGDLRWQEWPKASVFSAAVQREEQQTPLEAASGRLARNLAEGEPLMRSALLGESKGNVIAAHLEPGMRAIGVEVTAAGMVSGFIGPGDFVDVILTYRQTIRGSDALVKQVIEQNLDKLAAETILQNVKVLAVDQTATRPDDDKIKIGKTVTLAMSANEAEIMALAQEMGDIMLVLRGIGDDQPVEKSWKTHSDARVTSIGDEIFQEYLKIRSEQGLESGSVKIYSGGQVDAVRAR